MSDVNVAEVRDALQIQRDVLHQQLPARLARLLDDASNTSFDCGMHGEGSEEDFADYDSAYLPALRADIELYTELLKLLSLVNEGAKQ